MCGISGIVLREGERAEPELLERMARTLAHRGPDAQGVFTHENLGAAHRRLSILDLSTAANQPLFNEDGKVGVVFNGEIYNFRELRRELEAARHVFRTQSDTEVLVHAFEQWGPEAFARLNGIFAIGLWDLREGQCALYLARDRVGAKPLFYGHRDGRLGFASELKALLELPWLGREVDPRSLFVFLKHSHVSGPASILKDMRQVEPGTFLRLSRGELTEHRFWDPLTLSSREVEDPGEEYWLRELSRTLDEAVERQLVADVPVGCFLSGGIDSSLLVAAGQRAGGRKLKTFSIGYKEARFDETPFARQTAGIFGTDHRELIVEPSDLYDLIPEIPRFFDQPLADPTLLSTLLLCRFARQEVTVSLSGDGGDELFFGYEFEAALLRMRSLLGVPRGLRSAVFSGVERVLSRPALSAAGGPTVHQLAKLSAILQFRDEAELFQYFVGTVGPIRMDRIAGLLVDRSGAEGSHYGALIGRLRHLPWFERISQVYFRTFLPDTVLAKTDRASMAYGLEARVPLLDNEMLEFSARLPFNYKFRRGTKKYLLRQLLEARINEKDPSGKLGHVLGRRKKQGFSIPLRDWLRGDLKYLLDEYLSVPRLRREGVFEPAGVHQLVRSHLRSEANHSHLLWSLVTFQMWKERYLP